MAACTFLVGTADTGNTPNTSGAFVPTSGAQLIVFVIGSATVDSPGAITSSIGGFTFSQIGLVTFSGGSHTMYAFTADAFVSDTSSQTVSFAPADTANGSMIFVYEVTGMSKTGALAVVQFDTDSGTAAVTPGIDFAGACLTGNPTLGCFACTTNPSTITPNASWTEPTGGDIGYDNPGIGGAVCHRDSGFTGQSVDWASNSPSPWATIMVELDASGAAAITSTPKRLPLVGVA